MLNIEEVDKDGAIREAADAVQGDTRLSFLKKAGIGGGALMGGGAVLAALAPEAMAAGRPPSKFGSGDIGILNYALTLEYLESAFYNEASARHIAYSSYLRGTLETTTRDEAAHVKLLKDALGSKAVKRPSFDFNAALTSELEFAKTAFALENTGVHAYLGQAPNIKDPKYLLVAASIVTIEARHAAAIGDYLGSGPSLIAPSGSFDTGWSADHVLDVVASTHFIK